MARSLGGRRTVGFEEDHESESRQPRGKAVVMRNREASHHQISRLRSSSCCSEAALSSEQDPSRARTIMDSNSGAHTASVIVTERYVFLGSQIFASEGNKINWKSFRLKITLLLYTSMSVFHLNKFLCLSLRAL